MWGELRPLGGGDPIPLFKTTLRIGRRDRCDIVLNYPNVSSEHAELEYLNGYWLVRNLSSSNGTKVNGERINEHYLRPGDTLCFAKHCFEIRYQPDAAAPPPPVEDENPFAKSLLEKAGIVSRDRGRPERPSATQSTRPKPVSPPPAKPTDDDRALEWLMGDTPPPPTHGE